MEIFHQTGGSPEAAREMALSAFVFADHVVGLVEAANPLPTPIPCRAGCYYCCHCQVELTPPEALFLGNFLEQQLSETEKKELVTGLERAVNLKAGKSKLEIATLRQQLPCPLLREKKCGAYPARPLVCRAMHTLDARACENSLKTADLASPPYYSHRQDIFFAISQGLMAGCQAVGCQSGPLELTRALLDYFTQPRPLERWLKGEAVFQVDAWAVH